MRFLNRLICSAIIGAGLSASQITFAESHSESNKPIAASMLMLNNDAEKCTLSSSDDNQAELSITLLLDAPCYWVTTQDASTEEPLSYSYPEKEIDAVMLVAGGELDWTDEKKTYHKLPPDTECSQSLQGVIISDNEVYAVDTLMEAPHCKGLAVDEKVFRQAVDYEERYKASPSDSSTMESTTQETDEQENAETTSAAPETKIEPKEEDSLLGSIQKTIKKLFSSDD